MIVISFSVVGAWFLIGFIGAIVITKIKEGSVSVEDAFDALACGILGPVGIAAGLVDLLSQSYKGRKFLNKKLF